MNLQNNYILFGASSNLMQNKAKLEKLNIKYICDNDKQKWNKTITFFGGGGYFNI